MSEKLLWLLLNVVQRLGAFKPLNSLICHSGWIFRIVFLSLVGNLSNRPPPTQPPARFNAWLNLNSSPGSFPFLFCWEGILTHYVVFLHMYSFFTFSCCNYVLFCDLSITKCCITLLRKELIDSPDSRDVCGGGCRASNKVAPSPSLCSLWSSLASLLACTVYVLIKGSEKGGEPLAPIATEAERNESAATLCQLSVIINSLTILSANYAQSVSAFRAISF